jgi:3-oxoadipate enol-lactonase
MNTTLWNMREHPMDSWPKNETNPEAVERIHEIKAPVLIIHGDKDLPYIMNTSKYLGQSIQGSKTTLLPGLAHMLNLEDPKTFNKLLLEFLQ